MKATGGRRPHLCGCSLVGSFLFDAGQLSDVALNGQERNGHGDDRLLSLSISSAKVKISVQPEKANVFQINSEARFPDDSSEVVVRSVTRRFRRVVDGSKVRLEPANDSDGR